MPAQEVLERAVPLANRMADAAGEVVLPYFRTPLQVEDKRLTEEMSPGKASLHVRAAWRGTTGSCCRTKTHNTGECPAPARQLAPGVLAKHRHGAPDSNSRAVVFQRNSPKRSGKAPILPSLARPLLATARLNTDPVPYYIYPSILPPWRLHVLCFRPACDLSTRLAPTDQPTYQQQ